jgi:hypothetical protein
MEGVAALRSNFYQMREALTHTLMMVFIASSMALLRAQDLAPRAYFITPLHSNAVTMTYGYVIISRGIKSFPILKCSSERWV